MSDPTQRPRGNKGKSPPAEHCVICPDRLYRWPVAVSAHTGLGVSKLRELRREHPFSVLAVGEKKFVRGATIIEAIERAGVLDDQNRMT